MITSHPVRLLLIVSMLVCCYHSSFAQQEDNYIITKEFLSVEDGLASRDVFCAAQDIDGFMWFATSRGLQRYDGYSFTKFDFPELKDVIGFHALERFGQYLIISSVLRNHAPTIDFVVDTRNYQLMRFNEVFPQAPFKSSDAFKLAHDGDKLQFMVKNPFALWELNPEGIFRERCKMTTWSMPELEFTIGTAIAIFQGGNAIMQLLTESDYEIIFNSSHFKLPVESITGKPTWIIADKLITFEWEDYFVQTRHDYTIDVDHKALIPLNNLILSANEKAKAFDSGIGPNCIVSGNSKNGLQMLFPNDNIAIYTGEEHSTPGVHSVFRDEQENFWICNSTGLLKVKLKKNHFTSHITISQTGEELPPAVRGITTYLGSVYANAWDKLWCIDGDKAKAIQLDGAAFGLAMHKDQLINSSYPGVQYINPLKGTTKLIAPSEQEIWSLSSLNDSIIMFGEGQGIRTVNSNTGLITDVACIRLDIPKPKFTYRILESNRHGILAAGDNGVYCINEQLQITDLYGMQSPDEKQRICNTQVFDVYEDAPGDWWVATNGEGLIHIHWKGKSRSDGYEKQVYNEADGLPSDVLYRIEQDEADYLWISTYNGLVRFNKSTHSTKSYTIHDGISNNEFNRTSSFRATDGRMYFGTINGMVEFEPHSLIASEKTLRAPLRITAISKLDLAIDSILTCFDELKQTGKITLHTNEKSLTVQFALLDFESKAHHYAYLMEGIDAGWNYINENYVRINGLPYGSHKLRIKAQLSDGSWNEEELLIPIEVIAPFYTRLWFYAAALFGLLVLFFTFMRLRTRKLMRDKTKLENIVKKRTAKLNNALNDKDVLLKEIHHRVKNNLQVIAGLLQLQKVSLHDEHAITAINESQMRVNSIALIHQNMYQQENLEEIDFQHFLRDLFKNLKSLYEQEQKQLTFDLNAEGIALDIDTAVPLGLITNELLTNTYKHAFAHSTHVTAKLTLRKLNANEYELTYSDSGPGIPVDYNIEQSESLGMQLLQGLSQQLMGTLRYHSGVNHYFSIVFKNAEARKRS